MKIKTAVSFLLIISLTLLTGCWDYKEYESLAMVTALGFDCNSSASSVTVTLEYLVPGGGSASQSGGGGSKSSASSVVVKATGASIDDAFTQIQQAVGKKLFFGYMQVVVLGNSASKKIVEDIIAYFDRSPNIRTSAYIAVTPQSAEDILSVRDTNISDPSGTNIHELIDQSINTGNAYPVSLQDFEEDLARGGVEAVAPKIVAITSSGTTSSSSASTSSGAMSSSSQSTSSSAASGSSANTSSDAAIEDSKSNAIVLPEQKQGYFKINGMAAFDGENLKGWFDESESVGLGFIRGKKLDNYEVVKTSSKSNASDTIVFRITNSKCSISVKLENDKPTAYINAYVEADLRKFSKNVKAGYFTPELMDILDKKLAANVKNEFNDSLRKGQKELKTDAFGIGFEFYRQYPALWHSRYEKKWEQIFPTIKINVNVTAKVIDTGTNIEKFSPK